MLTSSHASAAAASASRLLPAAAAETECESLKRQHLADAGSGEGSVVDVASDVAVDLAVDRTGRAPQASRSYGYGFMHVHCPLTLLAQTIHPHLICTVHYTTSHHDHHIMKLRVSPTHLRAQEY